MKLGVYRLPDTDDDGETDGVYTRVALYDFDADEWDDTSDGAIVQKASRNPSPEELKVRFDLEDRRTIVCTPERMAERGDSVEIGNPDITVEEGHASREEQGGALPTQAEQEYRQREGIRVVPDDYDFTDEAIEWHDERGLELVRESNAEPIDFSDVFDFDFYAPNTSSPDEDTPVDAE